MLIFLVFNSPQLSNKCKLCSRNNKSNSKYNISNHFLNAKQPFRMIKEQKNAMVAQVLEPAAMERLSNIAAVKPEKAEILQNIIIGNIQRGGITGKISEQQMLNLLETFNEKAKEDEVKVSFSRKRAFDSDDDLDLDNLDL